MRTVALIDYGSGNLRSAEKALRRAAEGLNGGVAVVTTDDPDVIARADGVVLPGVGAFAACKSALDARPGVAQAMSEAVRRRGAPFLGVCVGMQLMATRGLEFGAADGLGWIQGEVRQLDPDDKALKIPHMGWNNLSAIAPSPLFAGLGEGTHMYFTHSFAMFAKNEADVAAWTDHGGPIAAAVVRGHMAGVQFHPEKSQAAGARLLTNFFELAPMILYPAIDLKDGQCVRVLRGDLSKVTVFNADPAAQARAWAQAGFAWLHVVDLSGSVAGRSVNTEAVQAILRSVSIPVQLGGGIRTLANIEAWIEAGVSRVILGTAAVRDPALVKTAARRWPEQIAVSVDVRAGQVAVQGWTEDSGLDATVVARRFEDAGVSTLIITDIDRDGALTGFNIEAFGAIADGVDIPVIAAGGLASVRDIEGLRARRGAPIAGAVLGRALYTGGIAPAEALAAAG